MPFTNKCIVIFYANSTNNQQTTLLLLVSCTSVSLSTIASFYYYFLVFLDFCLFSFCAEKDMKCSLDVENAVHVNVKTCNLLDSQFFFIYPTQANNLPSSLHENTNRQIFIQLFSKYRCEQSQTRICSKNRTKFEICANYTKY